MTDQRVDHAPWPMRAALLALLGALCGLLFDQLIRGEDAGSWSMTDSVARLSLAAFVASTGVLFAFTLERVRAAWSGIFAVAAGAVLGGIFYWNGTPDGHNADGFWHGFAALLAIAIAAPLFQAARDEGGRRFRYGPVHAHVWSNIVLWCAAWAFVLITWGLAQLLAELFQLIGIHLLRDLLDKSWANWMLVAGALGGAIGLLRDRDRVVGLLQRVVTTILAVLAPVLAVGLVLFVLALPFTGLGALWEQTRATTPILLTCVFGAFVLANAVLGTAPEEEAKSPALAWSAMALGAVMLPLAAVAAISTMLRVNQYGFTPERLWALVFDAIAIICALLYLYALVRGRRAWAERVRPANIRLAMGVCVVALLLATPLADFGAISTRSQLARLESGEVPPAEFDWRALRFDFGPRGIAALARLKAEGANPEVRRLAAAALRADTRWRVVNAADRRPLHRNLRVLPVGAPIPDALRDELLLGRNCGGEEVCTLIVEPGAARAVLVDSTHCRDDDVRAARTVPATECDPRISLFYRSGEGWSRSRADQAEAAAVVERHRRFAEALRAGRVEVRDVPRRQVFVDGLPVGDAFE